MRLKIQDYKAIFSGTYNGENAVKEGEVISVHWAGADMLAFGVYDNENYPVTIGQVMESHFRIRLSPELISNRLYTLKVRAYKLGTVNIIRKGVNDDFLIVPKTTTLEKNGSSS